jgi:hypothetical protein
MNKIFFACFFWILGIVGEDVVEDRLAARGKCRDIIIENNAVKIKFTSEEDAKHFANDLKELIEKGS